LTANLQLRSSPQPSRDPRRAPPLEGFVRGRGPVRPRVRIGAVLAEPRSKAPLRQSSRRRCCRPPDGLATRPLTSSGALGGSGASGGACAPAWRYRIPIASGRRARCGRRLVKDSGSLRARTPSIAECSLPRARTPLSRVRVGSRGARHRYRCSRAGGFRHRDPASGAISPPSRPACAGAGGLDPWPFDLDRAPLVDFCNQLDPRARPPTA